ncbi:hypothetical protein BS50DRAFT_123489 [Corynespora cassiicola Philippines]|uniref:Uncharacterized protein n=1 Tax=Corynespora cassiicola Philippines TaxID=1448308 RepID=A0A2T2NB04_CORCC|nr:hypothetical protein BS50DRAFT_123489 [Corynespora cassiicola Philippines]
MSNGNRHASALSAASLPRPVAAYQYPPPKLNHPEMKRNNRQIPWSAGEDQRGTPAQSVGDRRFCIRLRGRLLQLQLRPPGLHLFSEPYTQHHACLADQKGCQRIVCLRTCQTDPSELIASCPSTCLTHVDPLSLLVPYTRSSSDGETITVMRLVGCTRIGQPGGYALITIRPNRPSHRLPWCGAYGGRDATATGIPHFQKRAREAAGMTLLQ